MAIANKQRTDSVGNDFTATREMHVLGWATDCLDGGSICTSKEMTDIVPQRLLSDNGSDITVSLHERHTFRSISKIITSKVAEAGEGVDGIWVTLKEIAIVVV